MTWADAARRELAASVAQTAVCDTPRPSGSWLEHGRARTLSRMNEDSPDDPLDDDALKALLERPFTELSFDELMAMKAAYAARGIQIHNSASFEQLVLAFLAGNVAVPFVQALSQRAASSVADLSKQVTDAVRKHVNRRGRPGDTPLIELPDNPTDEAWLALFEMVKADELRGKVLRWDSSASAWRPDPDE